MWLDVNICCDAPWKCNSLSFLVSCRLANRFIWSSKVDQNRYLCNTNNVSVYGSLWNKTLEWLNSMVWSNDIMCFIYRKAVLPFISLLSWTESAVCVCYYSTAPTHATFTFATWSASPLLFRLCIQLFIMPLPIKIIIIIIITIRSFGKVAIWLRLVLVLSMTMCTDHVRAGPAQTNPRTSDRQGRLHHSSLGANVPWKSWGKHFSQSLGYWSSKFLTYHNKCHSKKCNRTIMTLNAITVYSVYEQNCFCFIMQRARHLLLLSTCLLQSKQIDWPNILPYRP